jgi:membrane-bound lytic murein transglycosylase D
VSYVVQRGDSLSVIAQRFNTSVAQLASLNQLSDRNTIRVGQELLLPHDTNMATQTLVAAVRDITPGDGVYTVMSGDTLSDIARRAGASEADIMQLNGMNNPDRLFPGQELRLPAESEQPVARARVNEAPLESSPEPALVGPVLPPEVAERIAASQAIADADEEQAVGMQTALSPGIVSSEGAGVLARETMPSVREQVASATELLAADPSDYSVASDSSIEIQATETLGHYADWLGIRTQQLRNLNGMNINQLVIVGNRLTLDFSEVDAEEFELRRRQYHIAQQEQFFRNFRIQDVDRYEIAANENIATIARQRYSVPLWLLRQYNPDLDFRQVRVGQTVVFPVVERVDDA